MAKTQRERDAEKRQEKLQAVRDQVDSGSLTIRKMTAEERAKWARPEGEEGRPARGRRKR